MKRTDSSDANGRLTVARIFNTDWEAHMASDVLAEHGIRSVIDNEIMAITLPMAGGVRLMVFEKDLPAAHELLKQL